MGSSPNGFSENKIARSSKYQKLKEPSKSYVLDLASHLFANDVILLMSTFNSLGEKQDMRTHSNNEENYDPPLSIAIHHHLTIICSIFLS